MGKAGAITGLCRKRNTRQSRMEPALALGGDRCVLADPHKLGLPSLMFFELLVPFRVSALTPFGFVAHGSRCEMGGLEVKPNEPSPWYEFEMLKKDASGGGGSPTLFLHYKVTSGRELNHISIAVATRRWKLAPDESFFLETLARIHRHPLIRFSSTCTWSCNFLSSAHLLAVLYGVVWCRAGLWKVSVAVPVTPAAKKSVHTGWRGGPNQRLRAALLPAFRTTHLADLLGVSFHPAVANRETISTSFPACRWIILQRVAPTAEDITEISSRRTPLACLAWLRPGSDCEAASGTPPNGAFGTPWGISDGKMTGKDAPWLRSANVPFRHTSPFRYKPGLRCTVA